MRAWLFWWVGAAAAQDAGPPKRVVPPSVLVEVAAAEDRFELALADDCPDRCYSRGCAYVAHTLADRPAAASLPGLADEPGPSGAVAQAWLTSARCEFAYEEGLEPGFAQALSRRLQTRASSGYAVVNVGAQALPPLPRPPAAVVEPAAALLPPPPPPWGPSDAAHELWDSVVDDLPWMFGLVLSTVAAAALVWSWRRLGRDSVEERLLLAEMAAGGGDAPAAEVPSPTGGAAAAWQVRIEARDPDVSAMVGDLLRGGELALLTKAVMTLPGLPALFPQAPDLAPAKLDLAERLRSAPGDLPSDPALFEALERHRQAAAVARQADADLIRALREGVGPAALGDLVRALPARPAAVLFALAPLDAQLAAVAALSEPTVRALCGALFRSDRLDPGEAAFLTAVVQGDAGEPPPDVTDRGRPFDAAGALSVLLSALAPEARRAAVRDAVRVAHGALPAWTHGILVPDLLVALDAGERADLLLGVDARGLAGWLSLLPPDAAERVLEGAPNALKASVGGVGFEGRAERLTLADLGRRAIAGALASHLSRTRRSFESLFGAAP